jgi:hypothetical protein
VAFIWDFGFFFFDRGDNGLRYGLYHDALISP